MTIEKQQLKFVEAWPWLVVRFRMQSLTDPVELNELRSQLMKRVHALPERANLLLNFRGVEFVSSQIIGIMLEARDAVLKKHGEIALCRVAEPVLEILRITRLEKKFPVRASQSEVVGDLPRSKGQANPDALDWVD
jgi:anti-sigma B factor antagonist